MQLKITPRHFRLFRHALSRKLKSRRTSCSLCRSSEYTLLMKSPNVRTPVFRSYLCEKVVLCRNCGFAFTNPILTSEELETYYSTEFLLEGLHVPSSVEQFLGDDYKAIWAEKDRDLRLILSQKKEGRLLDIGCASGALLYLARENGFEVRGIEIGRPAADFAINKLGLEVFCGQVENAGYVNGEFDIVTSIHSLEHVPDPASVLREVHRILRGDGVFVGAVPNLDSWSAREWGNRWRWLQPHNHYSHFTPTVLSQALEDRGFACEIRSEEGRYGEDEIRERFDRAEIERIYRELKGSELVFVARKIPPVQPGTPGTVSSSAT